MNDDLRAAIERAGGLGTLRDLGRRWNVSSSRAHELSQHPTFPAPVAHISNGTVALYAVDDVDAWRATPRPVGRPPGRRPPVTTSYTPDSLAAELGIESKALRRWLRQRYPAAAPGRGGRWELTPDHVAAARSHFV